MRRDLVGEDQEPRLVPGVEQLGELLGLQDRGHAQNAALLGRFDGVGQEPPGLDPIGARCDG